MTTNDRSTSHPSSGQTAAAPLAAPPPPQRADAAHDTPSAPSGPAENTRRAYASDWKHFSAWCRRNGHATQPLQTDVVGRYLAALAAGEADAAGKTAAAGTIIRRLSALAWNYAQRGQSLDRTDPVIASTLAAVRGRPAVPSLRKAAIRPADLTAMLETLDRSSLRGLRDRAILLIGFAGGLRRSQIVGLDCGRDQSSDGSGWVDLRPDGMTVTVANRTGVQQIEVRRSTSETTCPVAAVESWMTFARLTRGPLFRRVTGKGRLVDAVRLNDRHVARLVKQAALAAGIRADLSEGERGDLFSSHSLRAGAARDRKTDAPAG